jgi:GntR family transcriptional regulator
MPFHISTPASLTRDAISTAELKFRPLYQQVREELMLRLIDGRWPPGMLLPSEHQLAGELGVSQGTVRKALDALTSEKLLLRQQGRGTFVAVPEEGHFLFKFFRIYGDDGERRFPTSNVHSCRRVKAGAAVRGRLDLAKDSLVWQIDRTRSLDGRPIVFERAIVPVDRFPDLDQLDPIPNNVYALFSSRYGITVQRASERLKAVLANAEDVKRIGCPRNAPLLRIDRIAYALDGSPIEWRISHCLTEHYSYQSDLT